MSLRWRFLGAFILLIVLVVSLSLGVGYYTTQAQLDTFIGALSSDEANDLARKLSQAYTSSDGWETLGAALSETGYLFDTGRNKSAPKKLKKKPLNSSIASLTETAYALSLLISMDMSYKIASPSCDRVRSRRNWMDSALTYSICALASPWDMRMLM